VLIINAGSLLSHLVLLVLLVLPNVPAFCLQSVCGTSSPVRDTAIHQVSRFDIANDLPTISSLDRDPSQSMLGDQERWACIGCIVLRFI